MKNVHYTRKGPGRVYRTKPVRIEVPEGGFPDLDAEGAAREKVGALTQTFIKRFIKWYHREL